MLTCHGTWAELDVVLQHDGGSLAQRQGLDLLRARVGARVGGSFGVMDRVGREGQG